MLGEGTYFLPVENVKPADLLNRLVGETLQWDMDDVFFIPAGEAAPAHLREAG